MELAWFAWTGKVYQCEVLHFTRREEDGKWFAVVRPAPLQREWLPNAKVDPVTGGVAIPSEVIRKSEELARLDVTLAALASITRRRR